MQCPKCQKSNTKVIDSRPAEEGRVIRRRRECEKCTFRFTTFERVESFPILIIKKNGDREEFNREKILRGIRRACEKRPISAEEQEMIVTNVERSIREAGDKEISSTQIGELVMEELAELDDVAYIRFASVYREFKDIDVFMKEMKAFEQKKK